jgi:outer membrane biosynthesis protein TonB
MNVTKVLSTAMLFLLPGAIVTAYAQEREQEKKPEQKQEQAKPAKQQQAKPVKQQAQHEQQAKPAKQPQQAARQQQAKPAKQQQQAAHQQQTKPVKQQQRSQQAQTNRGPAAGGHGSIPEAKFRASFGSSHTFHVNRSEWASGSGRFQYGGYWFNAVDPWPVAWLYTDNVYVDFLNGGYFLCDPVHPGVYISINIG